MVGQFPADIVIGIPDICSAQVFAIDRTVPSAGNIKIFRVCLCTAAEDINIGIIQQGKRMYILPPTQDNLMDDDIGGKLISKVCSGVCTAQRIRRTVQKRQGNTSLFGKIQLAPGISCAHLGPVVTVAVHISSRFNTVGYLESTVKPNTVQDDSFLLEFHTIVGVGNGFTVGWPDDGSLEVVSVRIGGSGYKCAEIGICCKQLHRFRFNFFRRRLRFRCRLFRKCRFGDCIRRCLPKLLWHVFSICCIRCPNCG